MWTSIGMLINVVFDVYIRKIGHYLFSSLGHTYHGRDSNTRPSTYEASIGLLLSLPEKDKTAFCRQHRYINNFINAMNVILCYRPLIVYLKDNMQISISKSYPSKAI